MEILKLIAKWTVIVLFCIIALDAAAYAITAAMAHSARGALLRETDLDLSKHRPANVPTEEVLDGRLREAAKPLFLFELKEFPKVLFNRGDVERVPEDVIARYVAKLDTMAETFDRIEELLALPYYISHPTAVGAEDEDPDYWPIPNLIAARGVVSCTCLAAGARAYSGDRDGAFRMLRIARKMIERFREVKPYNLVSALCTASHVWMYARAVSQVAKYAGDDPRCREHVEFLLGFHIKDSFLEALECGIAIFVAQFRRPTAWDRELHHVPAFYLATPLFNLDRRYYMRSWTRIISDWHKPTPELLRLYALPSPDPPGLYLFSPYVGTDFCSIVSTAATTEAAVRLAACTVGIEEYRAKHGSLPKTLQDAPIVGGAETTTDPCTGQLLRYRLTGASYVLYSAGKDQLDSGGDIDRDLVWSREAK
ncbi:MAG: hypothetical protein WC712_00675 [Candidatus Brocadiia bacterium]